LIARLGKEASEPMAHLATSASVGSVKAYLILVTLL